MTVRQLLDEMAAVLRQDLGRYPACMHEPHRPAPRDGCDCRVCAACRSLATYDRLRACERCHGDGEWYSTDRGKEGSLRVTCHPCDCLREPGNARYEQDMSAHYDDGDEPIEPYSDGELTGF